MAGLERRLVAIDDQPLFCHVPEIKKRVDEMSNIGEFALSYAGIDPALREAIWPIPDSNELIYDASIDSVNEIKDDDPLDDIPLYKTYSVQAHVIPTARPPEGFNKIFPNTDPSKARYFEDGKPQSRPLRSVKFVSEKVISMAAYRNKKSLPPIVA